MRILMIAPQPFLEPRGAPFCVYQHIKALVAHGYKVDLVTYPFGKDIDLPDLRIYRAPSVPFIHGVKPGFSLSKFPLDLLVFLTALWRLCRRRYRYLHTHEEAALMGILLATIFGCKHLYYMHCDLSQLMSENALIKRCITAAQTLMVRCADAVIAFYPEITSTARRMAPGQHVYTLLPPAVDEELPPVSEADVRRLRQLLAPGPGPVLLYTGTLESYQGLDLLLRSVGTVCATFPEAHYVIVGGKFSQVVQLQQLAHKLGVEDNIRCVEQRPLEEMPYYMALADVLLSPRSKGTHVPLKLYTYLRSGKAILATDILSHTQILTPALALLVPPTPEGLAQGALELLQNPERAQILGSNAQHFASEHYSWPVFLEKSRQIYQEFMSLTR